MKSGILALSSNVMNQGCKLVNSTNVFVYHTERDSYFTTLILHFFFQRHHNSACQVFLQVQKPVGDLKSPLMSPAALYLFTDLHMRTEDKADREDIQETCPKETRKEQ